MNFDFECFFQKNIKQTNKKYISQLTIKHLEWNNERPLLRLKERKKSFQVLEFRLKDESENKIADIF